MEEVGMVQDTCVPVEQSCWANMPPELLRDVLMRIERSEDTWPSRKNVVSCAGVCRNWRQIVKEILNFPRITKHKRTHCVMDAIPASAVEPGGTAPTQTELDNFVSFWSPSGQRRECLFSRAQYTPLHPFAPINVP
ncbi:F-box domain [Arabidopsis thaliana x Arabidopsis arenosa]|uniref:F-box domain n=1 Tax=Arabidopsis thaliana x Arabidopsis arenosa TaxID=1240361 RepID=A0A8T2BHN1_9BRAS|nr:F-box domain [Arabidopsis thaliana x Arabidopsis arenosa]